MAVLLASFFFQMGVLSSGFFHSGTPNGVSVENDCMLRRLALEYGQKLAPQKGTFRSLFDALQLSACGMTPPPTIDGWQPPDLQEIQSDRVFHVVAGSVPFVGSSHSSWFPSLNAAVHAYHASPSPTTILLHEGTHFLTDTIFIRNGFHRLTFQNAPGERAEISGGINLTTVWKPSIVCEGCFEVDLSGQAPKGIRGLRRNGVREIRARYPVGLNFKFWHTPNKKYPWC
jgi:hypothetical protein